MIILSSLESA